jgi:DegV family protein with EDD domain
MRVALVTDSTAYLPSALLDGLDIRVVPLHVVVGGRTHSEGVDIDPAAVAAALRAFTPVTTSRPTPAAFIDAYEAAAAAGADSVVSVHLSEAMSSTIGSAHLAASESPIPVTVIDSRALGMVMGFAVLAGARLAAGGASAGEVADAVRATCAGASVMFYVDTLEYLRRGGRIGKAGAMLGSALAIKPILGLRDGQIVPLERVRTSAKALARMVDLATDAARRARESGRIVDICVQHLDFAGRAEELAVALGERVPDAGEVRVGELGAVVGAHVGPGTVAVSVSPRPESPSTGP